MAEIKATVAVTNRKFCEAAWEDGAVDDTFAAVGMAAFPEKTLQIIGTVDGADTGLQGSNDGGTTWIDLTSDGATVITGLGLHWVWENTEIVRPKTATNGGGSTSLTYLLGAPAILG